MDQTQPIIQYTTVSDSVYLWVKNAIIQGEFKPGEHIAQERLTKTLGVSRTPVRDAIKRLEAEGLLITKPHCGAVVFQLSKERLTEIYDIRILMEQYCAARTCIRASDDDIRQLEEISLKMLDFSNNSKEFMQLDRQFHTRFCEPSGCDDTVEILQGLWNKCDSFKSIYYSLEGRINDTLSEHAKIIQGHLKDVVECVGRQANFS